MIHRSIHALRSLLNALAPLIGAEDELGGKAVSPGWAEDASEDRIGEWSKRGIALVKEEMERVAEETCAVEYGRLMHKVRPDSASLACPRSLLHTTGLTMCTHTATWTATYRQGRRVEARPSAPHDHGGPQARLPRDLPPTLFLQAVDRVLRRRPGSLRRQPAAAHV